jgi:hypothetical protein
METAQVPQPTPPLKTQRSEDFVSAYANNVLFEQSVWDLKVIFGQLDQMAGTIEMHTAMTIPWAAAKLALYYLGTQIAAYELVNGKIQIPPAVVPPEPPPPPEAYKNDPNIQKIRGKIMQLREEFLNGL